MKNQIKLYLLTFILLLTFSIPANADNTFHNISGTVYFSPNGGLTEAIVSEINIAKSEIYVTGLFVYVRRPLPKPWLMPTRKAFKLK